MPKQPGEFPNHGTSPQQYYLDLVGHSRPLDLALTLFDEAVFPFYDISAPLPDSTPPDVLDQPLVPTCHIPPVVVDTFLLLFLAFFLEMLIALPFFFSVADRSDLLAASTTTSSHRISSFKSEFHPCFTHGGVEQFSETENFNLYLLQQPR